MGSHKSIRCEEEKEEPREMNQSTSLPEAREVLHLLFPGSLLHLQPPSSSFSSLCVSGLTRFSSMVLAD